MNIMQVARQKDPRIRGKLKLPRSKRKLTKWTKLCAGRKAGTGLHPSFAPLIAPGAICQITSRWILVYRTHQSLPPGRGNLLALPVPQRHIIWRHNRALLLINGA